MKKLLLIALILISGYLTVDIISLSRERQEVALDSTELNHIKYGLLSVYTWKEKITNILAKKIQEFQINQSNKREISDGIDSALKSLIREFELILNEKKSNGNWFSRGFARLFQSFVVDVDDLKRRIPEFRRIILDELDNYETREKLREFIQNRVTNLLYETVGEEDHSVLNALVQKYDLSSYSERHLLQEIIKEDLDPNIRNRVIAVIGISALIFICVFFLFRDLDPFCVIILGSTCLLLLIGGLFVPMLEIEASLEQFSFLFMGEQLSFENQLLFYQGKSILEVVQILFSQSDFQSSIVAIMIFVFSVLFPLIKLFSLILLFSSDGTNQSPVMTFFGFNSGKWSMADVFVVAIFMAFIGFRGVIKNQLEQLQQIGANVVVIATDQSEFGYGFGLFLAFCVFSLLLSSQLKRRMDDNFY